MNIFQNGYKLHVIKMKTIQYTECTIAIYTKGQNIMLETKQERYKKR